MAIYTPTPEALEAFEAFITLMADLPDDLALLGHVFAGQRISGGGAYDAHTAFETAAALTLDEDTRHDVTMVTDRLWASTRSA